MGRGGAGYSITLGERRESVLPRPASPGVSQQPTHTDYSDTRAARAARPRGGRGARLSAHHAHQALAAPKAKHSASQCTRFRFVWFGARTVRHTRRESPTRVAVA
eukprot:1600813-Prymnesium_polylepis.1